MPGGTCCVIVASLVLHSCFIGAAAVGRAMARGCSTARSSGGGSACAARRPAAGPGALRKRVEGGPGALRRPPAAALRPCCRTAAREPRSFRGSCWTWRPPRPRGSSRCAGAVCAMVYTCGAAAPDATLHTNAQMWVHVDNVLYAVTLRVPRRFFINSRLPPSDPATRDWGPRVRRRVLGTQPLHYLYQACCLI